MDFKKEAKKKIVIVVVLTNEIMNTNLKVGAGSPGIYDIPRSHKQISYDLQQKILGKKSKKALKVDQTDLEKKVEVLVLMNIIDKNSFQKFLKELVLLFFTETALLKTIRAFLKPDNVINHLLKINYTSANNCVKFNYI